MVGTFVAHIPFLGAYLGYDSTNEIAYFIATPSVFDPFVGRVQTSTNHPLFSFLEHLVYSITGSRDAALMRVLPILLGSLAVGLVIYLAWRRLGPLAGSAVGLLVFANYQFFNYTREVRGYSLVMLCAVLATLALERILNGGRRRWTVIYVAAVGAALATHLYAGLVPLAHLGGLIWAGRLDRRWLARIGAGLALGGVAYVGIAFAFRDFLASRGRNFQPSYPDLLVRALLGASTFPSLATNVATVLLLAVVLYGAYRYRDNRLVVGAICTAVAAIIVLWVVAPGDLYVRFFLFLVPGLAWAAGTAISARRELAVVVLVALLLLAKPLATRELFFDCDYRQGAAIADRATALGQRVCTLRQQAPLQPIKMYTDNFVQISTAAELSRCDVVESLGNFANPDLVRDAASMFPVHARVRGVCPGNVYSKVPIT